MIGQTRLIHKIDLIIISDITNAPLRKYSCSYDFVASPMANGNEVGRPDLDFACVRLIVSEIVELSYFLVLALILGVYSR